LHSFCNLLGWVEQQKRAREKINLIKLPWRRTAGQKCDRMGGSDVEYLIAESVVVSRLLNADAEPPPKDTANTSFDAGSQR